MANKMELLKFYLVTYNVGTSSPSPDQDLHKLLDLSPNIKNDTFLYDFYAIGLQEVKAQPQDMLTSLFSNDPWTKEVIKILEDRDYVKVKSIRMQGLLLNLFCLRKHLLHLREIETQYTRTGFGGIWGNKGAVSIRLNAYGCSVCLVNAHLTAHDHMQKERIEDYNTIISEHKFSAKVTNLILYHDYVFWLGDLNFRLMGEATTSAQDIVKKVNRDQLEDLLNRDQLRTAQARGEAFSEFTERIPQFPPTFKYIVGTSDFDLKRRPAWTDRILYKVSADAYENVKLRVEQNSYRSYPGYTLSDHKPVASDFTISVFSRSKRRTVQMPVKKSVNIFARSLSPNDTTDSGNLTTDTSEIFNDSEQVFSDVMEEGVEFLSISLWFLEEENNITFKISSDIEIGSSDWIGLFKDGFSSLDDYLDYVYVKREQSSTPTQQLASLSLNMPGPSVRDSKPLSAVAVPVAPSLYSINFSDSTIHLPGMYRLIYFGVQDDTTSILGMSASFQAQKRDPSPTSEETHD